jgi:C4-dicarboxylate-specific signal transduction histidine kinase
VSASDDGRVWNGTGAYLDLSIAHAWYQTNWFRAACVAAFFGTAWVLYRLRLRQIGREKNLHQEVQTALAHANRLSAMGQVTASIAHEVKSPITGTVINAKAALKILGENPPDLETVKQALTRIVRDSDRAVQIVDHAHSMAKRAPATKDDVALNAAIAEVMDMTRWQAIKYGVSVRAQLAENLPAIEGNRVQLQQVVLNLINNAIEAMSGSSEGIRELVIRTEARNEADVLVIVADTGPGFMPEVLTKFFEPFQTTKPNGLGLGLSICRSIVEAHGGQLSARANVPQGAVFQFSLRARGHRGGSDEAVDI